MHEVCDARERLIAFFLVVEDEVLQRGAAAVGDVDRKFTGTPSIEYATFPPLLRSPKPRKEKPKPTPP